LDDLPSKQVASLEGIFPNPDAWNVWEVANQLFIMTSRDWSQFQVSQRSNVHLMRIHLMDAINAVLLRLLRAQTHSFRLINKTLDY
jgi:hypothetical protein